MALDAPLQGSLFGTAPAALAPVGPCIERVQLDPCCWVDIGRDWLQGGDDLLVDLLAVLGWKGGTRLMYGKLLAEPRLTATCYDPFDPAVPVVVGEMSRELERHYGRPFDAMFCNYYRTGADSVAWHADRVGRRQVDPLVAIISLGGPRRFRVRAMKPLAGSDAFGSSEPSGPETARPEAEVPGPISGASWDLRSGDLLVMGGAMQHHWEHCVPKLSRACPRMSVTLRTGPGARRGDV